MIKYQETLQKSNRLRAMTGLTADEFTALVPPFQQAFETYMRDYTMDGYVRENRCYTPDRNSPLPSAEDKLLFILTYLKNNAIQEVQGQLFGMSQSNVSKWANLLHTVLNRALAQQNVLPARDAATLRTRLALSDGTDRESRSPFFTMARSAQ
jgi:Helix-turn-helix of DDE superfamily endonuclease